jgi:hypothetical protein
MSAWVWISTHLKLQHGSVRNPDGNRILVWHFRDEKLCILMVVCRLWTTRSVTYLLWIYRERHGGKFLGHMVLYPLSIKLRVTCVYVLFMVTICLILKSRSLKTMVLINGHWSILSALCRCLQRLTLSLVTWMLLSTTQWFIWNRVCFYLLGLGRKMTLSHITWTTEKFMSSLHITLRFWNMVSCHKSTQTLLSSLCSICSRSWSH